MMFRAAALALALTGWAFAQGAAEVQAAETERERVKALVEAGTLPSRALADAELAVEDARDQETLSLTLYARVSVEELTETQSALMLDAAQRRLERQQGRLAEVQEKVEAGAMARLALTPHIEELDRRRRVYDEAASRARLFEALASIVQAEAQIEQELEEPLPGLLPVMERFGGNGLFRIDQLVAIRVAFESQFGKAMPVSAHGSTALHRRMGFDHSGRVDVALYPDSEEGKWLRRYLESRGIPYYAFRGFVAGKATAAHIHIGPPSLRLKKSD